MGKRYACFVIAAGLIGVLTGCTLWEGHAAKAEGPPEREAEEAVKASERIALEEGTVLVETASPASALEDLREIAVSGVAEEALDAVRYAAYRELLRLEDGGSFSCETPVTRGEVIAALYRLSGVLERMEPCGYRDVPEELEDAAAWAVSAGVSGGVSEDRFAPEDSVTRSQLAVLLYRFAAWRGDDMKSKIKISGEVPAYAEEAWGWVLDRGLFTGMTEYGLYPKLAVSRLQLAEVLARLQRERDPLAGVLELSDGGVESKARANHEEIQAAVDAASKRHGAVGVQAAVVEKGIVTDVYTYGWAEKGAEPMEAENKMRTASLSKVVVGISAMLLREEGVIDLDADISEYWGKDARNPSHPETPVTIRSMLTHTSTILNNDDFTKTYNDVKARLGSGGGYGGGTPGNLENWSYNNYAFGVLGQTLELASGRYLDDILQERLLDVLEADCGFAAGDLEDPELVTPLYRVSTMSRTAASVRSIHHWASPGASGGQFAGGFTSSARDFAKLIAVIAGKGCFEGVRLMEAESVEEMERHSAQALEDGSYQAQPFRCRNDLYGRETLYYHTGSAYGVFNLLSLDPATGDGVVVLTMGADGARDKQGIYALCGEISEAVYASIK